MFYHVIIDTQFLAYGHFFFVEGNLSRFRKLRISCDPSAEIFDKVTNETVEAPPSSIVGTNCSPKRK